MSQELVMAKGDPILLKISMEEPPVGLPPLILWFSQPLSLTRCPQPHPKGC